MFLRLVNAYNDFCASNYTLSVTSETQVLRCFVQSSLLALSFRGFWRRQLCMYGDEDRGVGYEVCFMVDL